MIKPVIYAISGFATMMISAHLAKMFPDIVFLWSALVICVTVVIAYATNAKNYVFWATVGMIVFLVFALLSRAVGG